jgi:hypothetical protein
MLHPRAIGQPHQVFLDKSVVDWGCIPFTVLSYSLLKLCASCSRDKTTRWLVTTVNPIDKVIECLHCLINGHGTVSIAINILLH